MAIELGVYDTLETICAASLPRPIRTVVVVDTTALSPPRVSAYINEIASGPIVVFVHAGVSFWAAIVTREVYATALAKGTIITISR